MARSADLTNTNLVKVLQRNPSLKDIQLFANIAAIPTLCLPLILNNCLTSLSISSAALNEHVSNDHPFFKQLWDMKSIKSLSIDSRPDNYIMNLKPAIYRSNMALRLQELSLYGKSLYGLDIAGFKRALRVNKTLRYISIWGVSIKGIQLFQDLQIDIDTLCLDFSGEKDQPDVEQFALGVLQRRIKIDKSRLSLLTKSHPQAAYKDVRLLFAALEKHAIKQIRKYWGLARVQHSAPIAYTLGIMEVL